MSFLYRFASPATFYPLAGAMIPWFFGAAAVLALVGLYIGLIAAPTDFQQGDAYRIIYIHVPAAMLAQSCYVMLAVAGVVGLVWKMKIADVALQCAAPIGAWMTAVALVTGAIWGKPTWGSWWVWDARLTSMLILLFLYLGYIALASAERERGGDGRMAALFGLVGAVNLPIIHYSVLWWRTLHQGQSISITQGSSIAPELLWPLPLTMLGFTAIFAAVALMRMRAELARQKVEARLRRSAAE